MALADLLSVTILVQGRSPSQLGFGTPLLAAYHTKNTDRVREYASLEELVADGFATSDAVYKAANAVFSASPRVQTLKVGRRALAPTQVLKVVPLSAVEGTVISFEVDGVAVSYTVPAAQTLAQVCTAVAALVDALVGVSSAGHATYLDVTNNGATGLLHELTLPVNVTVQDITTDPGIATDLAAIYLADPDWYGLFLDSNGGPEIAAAATWAETHPVIFGAATADTGCLDNAVTTDPMSVQQTAAHARTFVSFHEHQLEFMQGAWLSRVLATKPGSATWANKALPGITPSVLTTTQQAAIKGKKGNFYSTIKSIGFTLFGWTGSGEWIDTTVGVDWLTDQLNTGAVALLSGVDKIPFTDKGADLWRAMIAGVLEKGIKVGFLAATPKPVVTVPLVADVSADDKTARVLPDVEFTATLAGAIHKAEITGRLSA